MILNRIYDHFWKKFTGVEKELEDKECSQGGNIVLSKCCKLNLKM